MGVDGGAYLELERAALVAYIAVVWGASALPARLLGWSVVVLVGAFALAPPLLSLDVFSYVSYARLEGLYELNPYEFAPESVPGDEALAFIEDHRKAVSVYGPLFTLGTLPLAPLALPAAVWALKALAGLSVVATAWLASRLAAHRGLDPGRAAALIALNPLVLVHVVGGAHNDALMVVAMIAGVAAIAAGRQLSGGAALVAATGVKVAALVALPFALLGAQRRTRLATGVMAAASALVALGLLVFGPEVREAVEVVSANQGDPSRASLPSTLSRELDLDPDLLRHVAAAVYAVAFAGLLVWAARGADWVRAAGWALFGLLLATSYLTPWYVIWALPAAAISRDRALVVGVVALTAFLLRYQVPGLGG